MAEGGNKLVEELWIGGELEKESYLEPYNIGIYMLVDLDGERVKSHSQFKNVHTFVKLFEKGKEMVYQID
jgi:hypothetical protein